jgi:tRNA-modifying protein YgfZ
MTDVAVPDQLRAARDGAVVERPDLAALTLTGADVLRYLHTVSSQHTADLAPGDTRAALLLSPKGKIEFVFRLAVLADRVVVACDTEAAEALAERLARFVFRYDVQVGAPLPGGLTLLGPAADQPELSGPDAVGFRTELGLDVLGPGRTAAAPTPRPVVGPDVLEALRIERGVPRWGRELTDDVIAEEAGLLGSHVHLDKGCYPGQETVARVHNLGQVQRRLAGLRFQGPAAERAGERSDAVHGRPPEAPAPFRADLVTDDGRRAGQVRSGVIHPELGPIALAYVRRVVADGSLVMAHDQVATVVELPFTASA